MVYLQDMHLDCAAQEMNVTQSYCLNGTRPFSWVHPLKHPQYMHRMAHIINGCARTHT